MKVRLDRTHIVGFKFASAIRSLPSNTKRNPNVGPKFYIAFLNCTRIPLLQRQNDARARLKVSVTDVAVLGPSLKEAQGEKKHVFLS